MADEIIDLNFAPQERPNPATGARMGMSLGLGANPDYEAELKKVARKTGAPIDTVRAYPDELKQQARMGALDFDALAQQFPRTAGFISGVENAKIAHDDIENMGLLETAFNSLKRGVPAAQSGISALSLQNKAQFLNAYSEIDRRISAGEPPEDVLMQYGDYVARLPWQDTNQALAELRVKKAQLSVEMLSTAGDLAKYQKERLAIPLPSVAERVVGAKTFGEGFSEIAKDPLRFIAAIGPESILQSLPGLVAAIPAGIYGGPLGSAATIGANSAATDYANSVVEGMQSAGIDVTNPDAIRAGLQQPEVLASILSQAKRHATVVGMLDAVSGGIAGKSLIGNKLASRPFAQEMANIALQAPVQGVLGAAGEAGGQLFAGQDLKPGDILAEAFGEFFGTPGEVVSTSAKRIHERVQAMRQAQTTAEGLQQLDTLVATSKVRERDPETFNSFIAAAAQDSPVQDVYVNAQTLQQSGVAEALAQVSPSVAEQLPEALATGGDIRIPVAEYAANIAGTEYNQSLIKHLKIDPNDPTLAEAQAFDVNQDALETTQQVVSEKQKEQVLTQSAQEIKALIKAQLGDAAKFPASVNDAYAAMVSNFYAVTAAKLGVTPQALYEQNPLKVVAGQDAGAQTLGQAPNPQTDTPEFKAWFGKSKVVGKDGKPLVVYHGTTKDFEEFKPTEALGGTIFFSENKDEANAFTKARGGQVLPVYLKAEKVWPHLVPAADEAKTAVKAKAKGYDAMRVFDGTYSDGTRSQINWAVFSPEQIKSAVGNSGAFDAKNKNILKQSATANRGSFDPSTNTIALLEGADRSTFLHEAGHFFLETQFNLSAQPNAPENITQDTNTLLKWFGVDSLAAWQALDFEAKREHHEQFARGFEAYIFEGKAPSIELQGVFRRFRAWFLKVYSDLRALDVELTDDVRGVMDRMLATDAQIAKAQQVRAMQAMFTTPEDAGMSLEELIAYQKQDAEATDEATQEMQARSLRDMQWLHNARGREISKLKKESAAQRAEVRTQVSAEVMQQPVYQAWQFLTAKPEEGVSTGKLSRSILADMYGGAVEGKLDKYALLDWKRLTDQRMTAEDGHHPDDVAAEFGFPSGDALVRALLAAEKPGVEIDGLTDARMLAEYGDLIDPKAIERAADKAIHNRMRSRVLTTEANALAKLVGKPGILASAAREFAAATIARLQVRELRPGQYAAAETRAAKASEKARKAGDVETAAAEKRNQVVNNYLTRAAYEAQDEVESTLRYLKKFDSAGVRKGLERSYLGQIDTLLAKHELTAQSNVAIDTTESLRTWVLQQLKAGELPAISESLLSPKERATYLAEVQSRDKDGELVYAEDEERLPILAAAIDRSAKRSYKTLTLEELRGLTDTVKQIEHLARRENKILTASDEASYRGVRDEIAGGIVAEARSSGKNTRKASDALGRAGQGVRQLGVAHIKVPIWARIMDGGKDNGPVWRYLVQPANVRATQETSMRAEVTERLDNILRPVLDKVPLSDKVLKGRTFGTIPEPLNWQQRFTIALNVGNESNMQRLLDGNNWTFAQIAPVLNSLSAEELRAVQAVWDTFESYRPLIAAKELKVSGKEPEWIPIRPITIRSADGVDVTLRGGYYPVIYDSRRNLKASQHGSAEDAKNAMKASYSAATTRRSFTKERVDEVHGRPLLLDLQGLYSGLNDVIHDLAWHEWVIDANKLLRSKTIDTAIREHYGPEVKEEFERWRNDIVAGTRRLDSAIERAVGFFRQNVSAAALIFNVLSAAMQPLGLINSVSRIGPRWVGKGIARYVSNPITATREALANSAFLANRTRTRFRELNELRNQVQGQTAVKELMGRYGYWMMARMQLLVDIITWWGAYEKALTNEHDGRTAVNLADQAVKDSQGGGEEVDQSGIERGGPFVKLFTAFYGFMGTTLNVVTLTAATERNKAKLAADMLLVLGVTPLLGALLKDALIPGDADDEHLVRRLAAEGLSFLFGLVALGREFTLPAKKLIGEGQGQHYSGPAGLRMFVDADRLAEQAYQGHFDEAFRKAFINTLGDLTGVPAVQLNRTITGAEALAEGKTANPTAIVFGYQDKR